MSFRIEIKFDYFIQNNKKNFWKYFHLEFFKHKILQRSTEILIEKEKISLKYLRIVAITCCKYISYMKIKFIIKKTIKYAVPRTLAKKWRVNVKKRTIKKQQNNLLIAWQKNGSPVPPPHLVKQNTINEYQKKYKYNVLIETGTYLGEMVEAQKKNFKKIISIELGQNLFEKAKAKFKNENNITIVHGDSGKVLSEVLKNIAEPVIFWLDGHYSAGITAKGDKDCPIFEELDAIFRSGNLNHILLIDDARCFNGKGDYPTVQELKNFIQAKNGNYQMEVKSDIIRFVI